MTAAPTAAAARVMSTATWYPRDSSSGTTTRRRSTRTSGPPGRAAGKARRSARRRPARRAPAGARGRPRAAPRRSAVPPGRGCRVRRRRARASSRGVRSEQVAQPDHVPDHDDRRGSDPAARGVDGHLGEGRDEHPLPGGAPVADHGDRGLPARPRLTSSCATRSRWVTAMSRTSVPGPLASASQSTVAPGCEGSRCAETIATSWVMPRCVSGIPASAGTATALVTPGTTSNGTPAATQASASSPPRPKTYGSPPLSRTTRRPARACSTIVALICSCVRLCACGALPASTTTTSASSSPSSSRGASLSTITTSASRQRAAAADGDEPGVPGAAADERHETEPCSVGAAATAACRRRREGHGPGQLPGTGRIPAGHGHGHIARARDGRRACRRRPGVVRAHAPDPQLGGLGGDRGVDGVVVGGGVGQPRAGEIAGCVGAPVQHQPEPLPLEPLQFRADPWGDDMHDAPPRRRARGPAGWRRSRRRRPRRAGR